MMDNMTTTERLQAARAEAAVLTVALDSYQSRLDAVYELIGLLEERDSRERLGVGV